MKTKVIFRKWTVDDWKDTIFALFPDNVETKDGLISSYEHNGGHGHADFDFCMANSVPAKKSEYEPLLKELEDHYRYVLAVAVDKHEYSSEIKAELLEICEAFELGSFKRISSFLESPQGYIQSTFETETGTYAHYFKIKS